MGATDEIVTANVRWLAVLPVLFHLLWRHADRGSVGTAAPGHAGFARDGDAVSAGRTAVLRPGDWVIFDGRPRP